MGVDTIVKIPGKVESNKIFDFIKEHFDDIRRKWLRC